MIELQGIEKQYRLGEVEVPVLQGIDLTVDQGEYVAIMGASGSGKSTLMHIIGCLDRPGRGRYRLAGRDITELDDDALADVRNRQIGFVFQQFNLLPRLTALENVMLPMIYAGCSKDERRERAEAALVRVGLADKMANRPTQLSGGQQQRVAIARALANAPALLLADEPTGALDSQTSEEVMVLLGTLNCSGLTIVLVTHDLAVANQANRIVRVQDGRIVDGSATAKPARGSGSQ